MRTKLAGLAVWVLATIGIGLMPATVLAASGNYGLETSAKKAGYGTGETVESSVNRVVSTFLALLAIIFFILVTYAGLQWMMARGNEETVMASKETLEGAVIGLVVVLTAYAITTFIFSTINNGGTPVTEPPPAPPANETTNTDGEQNTDGGQIANVCQAYITEGACSTNNECRWSRLTNSCVVAAVDHGCDTISDEIACNGLDVCAWWASDSKCHEASETPATPGQEGWCLVTRSSREYSCQATTNGCSGGPQFYTASEITSRPDVVCPLPPMDNPQLSCPLYSAQQCESLYGCVVNGGQCRGNQQTVQPCNQALFDDACAANSSCTLITSPTDGRGCASLTTMTSCNSQENSYKANTCDTAYQTRLSDCARVFNNCSFDTCQGGNDTQCIQNTCQPPRTTCESQATTQKSACYASAVTAKWTCVKQGESNFY